MSQNKFQWLYIAAVLLSLFCLSLWGGGSKEKVLADGLYAEIFTQKGLIRVKLDYENKRLFAANFVGLAEGTIPNTAQAPGISYFDGLTFYRVLEHYAVFSGDPAGRGIGGPGYTLPLFGEVRTMEAGALLMDGLPSESSGSRFFIILQQDDFLSSKYTHFGQVVLGLDVLKKIKKGDKINSVQILRQGAAAQAFTVNAESFQELYQEARMKEFESLRQFDENLYKQIINLGESRQKTLSGIYYSIETKGEGARPVNGSKVFLNYSGMLSDGTVFDSSLSRGQVFEFVLGEYAVIPGWAEMVIDMQIGEKRRVIIPPAMAYGNKEYGSIPPNSWLVFDMELLSMEG